MKVISFYLPQFHQIEENDAWWGEGFTEWVNVRRARPQFVGHAHPRVPVTGEYDLTEHGVLAAQCEQARQYGIDAFCIYFYWFDGKRLLERPLEQYRQDATLLPYCISWANESWNRRWDGKEHEVLMPQTYPAGFAEDVFEAWRPHFAAPHYLRHQGKPVVMLHRADLVPELADAVRAWRRLAHENDLPGLYLVGAETKAGLDPRPLGLDAVAEFPPVGANTLRTAQLRPLRGVEPSFRGRLLSYDRLVRRYTSRATPDFVRHRGVSPMWDNTARRGRNATVFVGSTPGRFREWVRAALADERRLRGQDGLVFINAWNEWAEGAYLEPDTEHGDAYLRAVTEDVERTPALKQGWSLPRYPQLHSWALLAAGSVLSAVRAVRFRVHAWRR